MDYNSELFEKLREIAKEHNVTFWTAQQQPRKFSGHTRLMNLKPHFGKSRYIGFIPMDHTNLIK